MSNRRDICLGCALLPDAQSWLWYDSRPTDCGKKDMKSFNVKPVQDSGSEFSRWLLTGFNSLHHIFPVLASLHWLPVCCRIDFKISLITLKTHRGLASEYITACSQP